MLTLSLDEKRVLASFLALLLAAPAAMHVLTGVLSCAALRLPAAEVEQIRKRCAASATEVY